MERRIDEILGGARDAGKTVQTPYLCAGYPDNEALEPMLAACEHAGCPIAILAMAHATTFSEGADVAAAMGQVLSRGVKIDAIFELTRRARAIGAISGRFGLVAAVSAALLHRDRAAGPAGFMRRAKAAGFDGVLVVDVPLEEAGPYRVAADEAGVQFPMIVATSTPQPRVGEIAKVATGFLLLKRVGRASAADLANAAARLRSVTQMPILVGSGATSPSHVRTATELGDGVVIAGALARCVAGASGKHAGEQAGALLRELAAGLAAGSSASRSSGGAA